MRLSVFGALAIVAVLMGWRYHRTVEGQRSQMQGQIMSQKTQISTLEEQVQKKQDWEAQVFEFEMGRLKQLRTELAAAQKAVEASSARVATLPTPGETAGQQAGRAAPDSTPAPVASPEATPQDLRQRFSDLRVAQLNVMKDYDLQVAQVESSYLQEDSRLARLNEEAQNNVFRLADEVASMAGYVDLQSLKKLENLRAFLVDEQTRANSLRMQREALQNQLKQEKIQAQVARELALRSLQVTEIDLQGQIATAQEAASKVIVKPVDALTPNLRAREQLLREHQQLGKELELKKQLLAQEEQQIQKLLNVQKSL